LEPKTETRTDEPQITNDDVKRQFPSNWYEKSKWHNVGSKSFRRAHIFWRNTQVKKSHRSIFNQWVQKKESFPGAKPPTLKFTLYIFSNIYLCLGRWCRSGDLSFQSRRSQKLELALDELNFSWNFERKWQEKLIYQLFRKVDVAYKMTNINISSLKKKLIDQLFWNVDLL
jgi:hypothetical protein